MYKIQPSIFPFDPAKVSTDMKKAFERVSEAWPFPTKIGLDSDPILDAYVEMPVETVYVHNNREHKNRGSFTVVYQKLNEHRNCRMVELAVAYCSPKDTFVKKTGRNLAMANFYSGQTIVLPLRKGNDESIYWNIVAMLETLYY